MDICVAYMSLWVLLYLKKWFSKYCLLPDFSRLVFLTISDNKIYRYLKNFANAHKLLFSNLINHFVYYNCVILLICETTDKNVTISYNQFKQSIHVIVYNLRLQVS